MLPTCNEVILYVNNDEPRPWIVDHLQPPLQQVPVYKKQLQNSVYNNEPRPWIVNHLQPSLQQVPVYEKQLQYYTVQWVHP